MLLDFADFAKTLATFCRNLPRIGRGLKINQNYSNNTYKQPVKICGYVYYTGCCVCGKNSVGKGTTPSCYNNIITNPSYKQNNKINELIICCSCAKTVKGKTLLDTNSNMYKVEEIILQPNDS